MESLKGRGHSKDIGVGERILELIYGNRVEMCGLDASGSGYGPISGCCEHGNEP
jgi:hypothetical protein